MVTEDDHILIVKPLKSVEEMTETLITFLGEEEIWRNEYKSRATIIMIE